MSKFAVSFVAMVLLFSVATASIVLPSPVVLMEPGPALEVGLLVSVAKDAENEHGRIYLTSVAVRIPTLAQWAMALLDPNVRVVPADDFQPKDLSAEEFRRLQTDLLDESKTIAKIVALRELGYDVKASGQGARVESILSNSPAEGKLELGDTIVGVNGGRLETATELVEAVRKLKPGDEVSLTVVRGDKTLEVRSATTESSSEPGHAMVGVLVSTRMFEYSLPFDVRIDTENLGGPSAGMMFTLGIIDALTPGDLASGHKVAGTGTINVDGTIGKIDGVKQKVIGAERAGAEYFLAPSENYDDALKAARTLKVVSVRTVDDSLSFLSTLREQSKAKAPAPAVPSLVWSPAW
ncbi:MAG: PDZ domain-containing protein [Chloroflexi bacterium]|nr:PDZ domain-containing protein [Chloroflexota bacterium]